MDEVVDAAAAEKMQATSSQTLSSSPGEAVAPREAERREEIQQRERELERRESRWPRRADARPAAGDDDACGMRQEAGNATSGRLPASASTEVLP